MSLKISILGADGRMGKTIKNLIQTEYSEQAELDFEMDQNTGLDSISSSEAVIDFSLPDGTQQALRKLQNCENIIFVSGTTGLNEIQIENLKQVGKKNRISWASNFSIGVYAFRELLSQSAPLLKKLGYQVNMEETHHIHKKDKPSGTAVTIMKDLSENFGSSIPSESLRKGETIGDHRVFFKSKGDQIEFRHTAHERKIFARGAIEMTLWLKNQKNGFYQLSDYFKDLQK